MTTTVFETDRLRIRIADVGDADLYFSLWKDPRVMRNVGFPEGLPIMREEIVARLERGGDSEFERLLVVERKADGVALGECYLHVPDEEGIAGTDVKLLPENWGHRYGVEVKQGLVDYLFQETSCEAVGAAPNVKNPASIHMQEAVGGVRIREEAYEFPTDEEGVTEDMRNLVYRVFRETWEQRRMRH